MTRFATAALACLCIPVAAGCAALGDTKVEMKLKNGETIEGRLLQNDKGESVVQVKYGTVTVTHGDITATEKKGKEGAVQPGPGRLANWESGLHALAKGTGFAPIAQVPATVIDRGVLKNVPYMSYRSGPMELNVYGDPDAPACLEIGLHAGEADTAKRRACRDTMAVVLNDPKDREILQALNLEKAAVERSGAMFEVSPPTDEDAYGGWWVLVYDKARLEEQRATEQELGTITVSRGKVKTAPPDASVLKWKPVDLKHARPAIPATTDESRVYRRGVHRRNGVYVVAADQ